MFDTVVIAFLQRLQRGIISW